jgi:hypothetical protein
MDPATAVKTLTANNTNIKDISKKVKDLQTALGLDKLREKNKELKEVIYNHMDVNDLEEYMGVKITSVMPSDVKKSIRIENKKDNIAEIIENKISQDELEDVIEKLAVL